jgi:hypothetical protein
LTIEKSGLNALMSLGELSLTPKRNLSGGQLSGTEGELDIAYFPMRCMYLTLLLSVAGVKLFVKLPRRG